MAREVWFELVDQNGKGVVKAFPVSVAGEAVYEFMRAVYEEHKSNHLRDLAAADLEVYANRNAYYSDPRQEPLEADENIGERGRTKKDALVVEFPSQAMPTKYLTEQGGTVQWRESFLEQQIQAEHLPAVDELKDFLQGPLAVKIGVPKFFLDLWAEVVGRRVLEKLFVIANSKPCVAIMDYIKENVIYQSTLEGSHATESSYHCLWDNLIRRVFDRVIQDLGRSNRDSCHLASTGTSRPDFLFTVDRVCVFRGEEKSPGVPMETPRKELWSKLEWSYGDVPYLFGYAAVGHEVCLYAITHSDESGVITQQLGATYRLTNLNDRCLLMLALLNMSRLLRGIASMCPEEGRDEYQIIHRLETGVVVYLEPNRVIKAFPEVGFDAKAKLATAVYNVVRNNGIPNVDQLLNVNENTRRMVFIPRGKEMKPCTLQELHSAVRDVLTALVALHAASWMHRDIRWSNVMKRRDGSMSWFLIDFMDAAESPQTTKSGAHLNPGNHAPEMSDDHTGSHTTAVDIWSVGHLLATSAVAEWVDNPECMVFTMKLQSRTPSKRPTAEVALKNFSLLCHTLLRTKEEQHKMSPRKKSRADCSA